MKALELLVLSLDPNTIYGSGERVAWTVFSSITPVLLVIAVAVRTLETQLDTSASLGKWERAIRDFFLFGFLIGSYFGIMMLFNVLMNEIYLVTHDFGSFEILSKQMSRLLDEANQGGGGALDQALGNFSFGLDPFRWIMSLFYWASNLFLISTHVFLKGAQGVIYAFVLVYGLIAIPVSITSGFKLLKGWGYLLGGTLLWPIVEGLLMNFFGVLFQDSAQQVINAGGVQAFENDADFKAFFSVVNVVLAILMMMAPVISAYLVANANSMFALVAPFASGSMSVGLGALATGRSMMPGGKGNALLAAGAGMMGLTNPGVLPGEGGSGSGSSSYSGGPNARSDDGSGGSSGRGASRGAGPSAGAEASVGESSAGPHSDPSSETSQEVKAKKRKKARTGHFANEARKKAKSEKG